MMLFIRPMHAFWPVPAVGVCWLPMSPKGNWRKSALQYGESLQQESVILRSEIIFFQK
jgi:hypothetical protein